jgi:putative transposase
LISRKQLNSAYRKETDAVVKERILLVKHVRYDKKEASSVAEIELNKTRTWAYKWLHRFDRDGLEGLKDKERSGRPPSVSKEIMVKIRKELEDSNTGWDFRQVMDLIYKRARVRYHEVHTYTVYYTSGVSNQKYYKKGL